MHDHRRKDDPVQPGDDQGEMLWRHARKGDKPRPWWKDVLRRNYQDFWLFIISLVVLLTLVISITNLESAAHRDANVARQQAFESQCRSDNVTTASDNTQHYADYKIFAQQIKFTKGSLRANFLALKKIGLGKTILDRALRQAKAQLATQEANAMQKTWRALTNCTAQATGVPAISIYSIAMRPPPWYALGGTPSQLHNASRPDPVGSLP